MTKANCVKLFTNNLKDTVLYGISMPRSISYLFSKYDKPAKLLPPYQTHLLLDYGGDKMNQTIGKIADINDSDSISLRKIDGKAFTIVNAEPSNYEETPGVKITTAEKFNIEGEQRYKFHTTRVAIVRKLLNDEVLEYLNAGGRYCVRCSKRKNPTPGKQDYYILEDV